MSHIMWSLGLIIVLAACGGAADSSFWQPGKVRELFISGLPADEAALKMWAENGVNCVTGVPPELAHKIGLRTRAWFTMNYMDSRNMSEERIKSMAAVRADGSFLRPYDPLFPTVGQYGWTACINNPLWQEHAQNIFRSMGKNGYDGCHVDFASHYENCFCEHCQQHFREWAAQHGLGNLSLKEATQAAELPIRMKLREFRIQCVMNFLESLRAAARASQPDFALDGTWHQDNGSTYQWAYGNHFDLMCIEGTTWGPFPPASTQVPWIKLAHALSRRPNRQPVAMSVTYHLLTDEQGRLRHGRMAADRLRVALAEIISEGAVSWLGLGGPQTGNLLKEHQEIVKAYYRLARDMEPLLVGAQEIAEIGLLFSPRSFLLRHDSRLQLYAFCQALAKAHIPYRIFSDVNVQASDLTGLSGLVILDGRALSDEACVAITNYVEKGGKLLVLNNECASLGPDWQPRTARPAFAVVPAENQEHKAHKKLGHGDVYYWLQKVFEVRSLGAVQYVELNQTQPQALAIEGYSKAEGVTGQKDSGYSLYVDLTYVDGGNLWGQVATFDTGTHDWQFSRTIITSDRPFKSANVHILFRGHGGTAYFKDVRFGVWDPAQQQIVQNLLSPRYQLPDGTLIGAADAQGGKWMPYGEGFTIENMLEQGLWVKTAAQRGLEIGSMHLSDPSVEAPILEVVKPLLAPQRIIHMSGTGAELVTANLTRTAQHLTLHLINYAAQLYPELPELEQQEREHSLPARNLSILLNIPDIKLKAIQPQLYCPEGQPEMKCRHNNGQLQIDLSELRQYAVLAWEID